MIDRRGILGSGRNYLVGVVVLLRKIGLVHVRMRVFGSVGVFVRMVVLDVVVLVAAVRVRVRKFVVAVLVGVRFIVTVLIVCHCHLPVV